jgi:hypothetical protein
MPAEELVGLYAPPPEGGGLTVSVAQPKRKGPARPRLPTPPAAARSPGGDD